MITWRTDNGEKTMKEMTLQSRSFAFAVRIVNLCRYLSDVKKESVLSRQLLRSGTAIGALVREAEHAGNKTEFAQKIAMALKEANETEYWILLLRETGYLNAEEAESVIINNRVLLKLLTGVINYTKQGMAQEAGVHYPSPIVH